MPNQPRLKVSDHFVGLFRVFQRVINTIDVNLRRTPLDRVIVNLRNFPRLTVSRKSLVVACPFLVGIVGYIDYLTGYERSPLLFYLLPISLVAWFGSLRCPVWRSRKSNAIAARSTAARLAVSV
jgi:hypothetical protein